MIDYCNSLNFTTYNGYKVVGTHDYDIAGNGLIDKTLKEVIIPERHHGIKVREIGYLSFINYNIEYVYISKYVKTILRAGFYCCKSLKSIVFDQNSELEHIAVYAFEGSAIKSINFPPSFKTFESYMFHKVETLECASYMGYNDISSTNLFSAIKSTFTTHSLINYQYTIGGRNPSKDNMKCPEEYIKTISKKVYCKHQRPKQLSLQSIAIFLITQSIKQN